MNLLWFDEFFNAKRDGEEDNENEEDDDLLHFLLAYIFFPIGQLFYDI